MSRRGPTFDQLAVGQSFADAVTMTESHIVQAAGLFGDFAPLHVNEEFARGTVFGTRIAHGPLITGIAAGVLSSYFHGTAIGYLEENFRFLGAVKPGDTLTSQWTIRDIAPKAKLGGAIVSFDVECRIGDDAVVLAGTAKAIIRGDVQ